MALCTSLSLSILGPPFLVAFAAAGSCSFAIRPYIACVCFRVWASIPFIPSSFLFVLAAPGCSLIPLLLRGGGGLLFFIWSLAVSTLLRWRLLLLLLALLVLACACGRTTCPFCALGLCVRWQWSVLPGSVWLPSSGFVVSQFHTITSFRLGCPLGTPSYHACSVPRYWRPFALCVFFGGVHIFLGAGSL